MWLLTAALCLHPVNGNGFLFPASTFCRSMVGSCDVHVPLFSLTVIRAKVVGEKEVDSGNDIYGNPIKRILYEVKQIKVRIH